MILGLSLNDWVKIIFISLLIFGALWTVIEMFRGTLTIEFIEEEEEENGGTKDKKSTPK